MILSYANIVSLKKFFYFNYRIRHFEIMFLCVQKAKLIFTYIKTV